MKPHLKSLNYLFGCFALLFSGALAAQSTHNYVIEKVYLKWLPANSTQTAIPQNFCFEIQDLILEGSKVPPLSINASQQKTEWVGILNKKDPSCELVSKHSSVKTLENSPKSIKLRVTATVPFSRHILEDSRGQKVELLVETRMSRLEDSDFLNFFRDSSFGVRLSGIRNSVWQIPFLQADYELPTLFSNRLALQISLGQSLFDALGSGIRQSYSSLGLATPILGSRIPGEGRYSFRGRVQYEGTQIDDYKGKKIYPLLASQMFGAGLDLHAQITPNWGTSIVGTYLISKTQVVDVRKLTFETKLLYSLSERWRFETGLKIFGERILEGADSSNSSFQEASYFVGVTVKPYLRDRR
jgi:hypothetical protein